MDAITLAQKIAAISPSFSLNDGSRVYIVERDLQVREADLLAYARSIVEVQHEVSKEDAAPERLTVATIDGKPVRWAPGTRLTWWIDLDSFGNEEWANAAHSFVTKATQDWNQVAEDKADICFEESNTQNNAVFSVKFEDFAQFGLIAVAFFPQDPVELRSVRIGPMAFEEDLSFDPIGVLRHELGHVLGFRHEHIRHPELQHMEAWTTGNMSAEALTDLDTESVMHYLVGGYGDPELRITELDRKGLISLYTKPDDAVKQYHP